MVEKVPSFKGGGALWLTDLTTPDSLYLLPVLTGLIFLATVEVCTLSVLVQFYDCPFVIVHLICSTSISLLDAYFFTGIKLPPPIKWKSTQAVIDGHIFNYSCHACFFNLDLNLPPSGHYKHLCIRLLNSPR